MNILHISSNYPPLVGGPAASVPYLAIEQAKQGNDVFVLTHGLPKITEGLVTVYRCGEIGGDITSIRKSLEKGIRMGILGMKIIRKHNIDIIHAHDPNVSAIASIMTNPRKRTPSLIKYSGDLAWELLGLKKGVSDEERFWNLPLTRIFIEIERSLLNRFDKVMAQSIYQKGMLKEICGISGDKIVLIPNGVHIYEYLEEEFQKAKDELPEGLKIASVCRLVPWKGLEFGIRAMKTISTKGKYIIFGEGPDKHRLEEIAKEEGVSDKVIFFGRIPHEKVQLYLHNCDILLVPSIYEPFGISILDGFAAGIPVVGSNVGGIPELIDKTQFFESKNIEDIGDKINYALENKEEIIKNQNRKIKDYSWSKIAKDLQREYESLI